MVAAGRPSTFPEPDPNRRAPVQWPHMSRQTHDVPAGELAALLEAAAKAGPLDRIDYRDRIASHGKPGLEAVRPWLTDPKLQAFAIQVVARIGESERTAAAQLLSKARKEAPDPSTVLLIEQALARLGVGPVATTPGSRDPLGVRALPAAAGAEWPGFQEREFGQIAGTSWRSRDGETSLAPIITKGLRIKHPHFDSFAVERSPMLHWAVTDRYRQKDERESGWRAAKLIVYAAGPTQERPDTAAEVIAGLYFEKSDGSRPYGPLDERWDWTWFIQALGEVHLQRALASAMDRYELSIGDYRGLSFLNDAPLGWLATLEEGQIVLRDDAGGIVATGFDEMAELLKALPGDVWHNLHIWRSWRSPEAIEMGRSFADRALEPLLGDLATIYLDIVRPAFEGRTG